MDGINFQIKHHRDFLKARSVDRIIQTDFFRIAWDSADEKDQQQVVIIIGELNIDNLNNWLFRDFENCTVRDLRKIASANHVLNYCDMNKAELIHHFIKEKIKNVKDSESFG